MTIVKLARNAMATRFELILPGNDPISLRAAGEEALDEIGRIESLLSAYLPMSEISRINAEGSMNPVRVSPMVFDLLVRARELWRITEGAFDVTVGPLIKCWGFARGKGSVPSLSDIAAAREHVGMDKVDLNESNQTVFLRTDQMAIDLGSIGKGYAIDVAIEILRECGVEQAFLQGGTSSMYAIGDGRIINELNGWKVSISRPSIQNPGAEEQVVSVAELKDCSLSVSGPSGKFFTHEGRIFGHVIDPRTGWPGDRALVGAVRCASAAESDALSTAVLLGSERDLQNLHNNEPPKFDYLQIGMSGRILSSGFQILAPGEGLGRVS
jgi:thiamine biosynthesis lipoprotein